MAANVKPQDGDGRLRPICPNCPNSVLNSWGSANPIGTGCPNCPNLPQLILTCTERKTGGATCVLCGQRDVFARAFWLSVRCGAVGGRQHDVALPARRPVVMGMCMPMLNEIERQLCGRSLRLPLALCAVGCKRQPHDAVTGRDTATAQLDASGYGHVSRSKFAGPSWSYPPRAPRPRIFTSYQQP